MQELVTDETDPRLEVTKEWQQATIMLHRVVATNVFSDY